jgi:hypothetical protein
MTKSPFRLTVVALCLVAVAAVLVVPPAAGQSLGDLAKKEQDRRKPGKPSEKPAEKKVYTNKDLTAPTPPTPAPAASQPAPTPAGGPAQTNPGQPQKPQGQQPQGETKDEAWWRARITTARTELSRNEIFLEALQSRINALNTDFVNRDDPAQRQVIANDRQRALAEMERVRGEIEKLKKQIVEIEEEARQAGVPPGWLR